MNVVSRRQFASLASYFVIVRCSYSSVACGLIVGKTSRWFGLSSVLVGQKHAQERCGVRGAAAAGLSRASSERKAKKFCKRAVDN